MGAENQVDKLSVQESSYLFRADDNYKRGNPIGYKLDSEDAIEADIQSPLEHVLDKESGQTSRYVSFSNAISIKGQGGAKKFTKNNKIFKVSVAALQQLEAEGKIRIYNPEQIANILKQSPKKKVSQEANNVKAVMEKNGEILIEGQIPSDVVYWVN